MLEADDPRRQAYEAYERAATSTPYWQPIYADVSSDGVVLGRVSSDGYRHCEWQFWPEVETRRCRRAVIPINHERRAIDINAVLPAWCGKVTFSAFTLLNDGLVNQGTTPTQP